MEAVFRGSGAVFRGPEAVFPGSGALFPGSGAVLQGSGVWSDIYYTYYTFLNTQVSVDKSKKGLPMVCNMYVY